MIPFGDAYGQQIVVHLLLQLNPPIDPSNPGPRPALYGWDPVSWTCPENGGWVNGPPYMLKVRSQRNYSICGSSCCEILQVLLSSGEPVAMYDLLLDPDASSGFAPWNLTGLEVGCVLSRVAV